LTKRVINKAKEKKKPTVLYLHYAGHGFINIDDPNKNTRIQHHDESYTNIEYLASNLADNLNVFVILQLDCCRN
jgi:hypothetical protein